MVSSCMVRCACPYDIAHVCFIIQSAPRNVCEHLSRVLNPDDLHQMLRSATLHLSQTGRRAKTYVSQTSCLARLEIVFVLCQV